MGNRALTNALNQLAQINRRKNEPIFQTVIMAAPDVDQKYFRQIESAVRSTTKNLTLYASDSDRALQISARIHKEPRLGQAGDLTLVSSLLDTVDASEVDTSFLGHAYYGNNASVMDDIYQLVMRSLPPALRQPMVLQKGLLGDYWRIRRASQN
jgi:esterase/lipase superfamily enzyme